MSSVFIFKNLLGTLLLPPANGLLLLLVAALFRRRRWAFGLALIGGVLLFLQSLPIVASTLVASQLGWQHGHEILAADDPQQFAEHCQRLCDDPVLWQTLRQNALQRIKDEYSPRRMSVSMQTLLKSE